MQLMYAPGTCAIGIHIILEEIGRPYELVKVDFPSRAQYLPAFTAKNPKSKVPVLIRDDGTALTEFQAIAVWLGLTNPDKRLIPPDAERYARMLEMMDYVVGTMHGHLWKLFWRTVTITPNEAEHPALKARGRDGFEKGLRLIDGNLAGKDWVVGDFSLADPTLFFVCNWGVERMKTELPPNVAAHYQRMLARPSVQRALKMEGL